MKTSMLMFWLILSWGGSGQQDHSKMSQSNMETKMKDKSNVSPSIRVERSLSMTSIIDNYLALKNALTEDNANKAASSGKMLLDALGKFNISGQSESKRKELKDITDDAKEHAEHISKSNSDIEHQREHFGVLITDLKDLIVIAGTDRNLYMINCPMSDKNKGGKWLSESKEVRNPFLGRKMLKCGSVIQEVMVK